MLSFTKGTSNPQKYNSMFNDFIKEISKIDVVCDNSYVSDITNVSDNSYFIVNDENVIVGFIQINGIQSDFKGKEVNLEDIYILPQFRHLGYGKEAYIQAIGDLQVTKLMTTKNG